MADGHALVGSRATRFGATLGWLYLTVDDHCPCDFDVLASEWKSRTLMGIWPDFLDRVCVIVTRNNCIISHSPVLCGFPVIL